MSKKEYWVTNISKMNVSLSDLNLTIKAFSSVNLLDKKHYSYTFEQLYKSTTEGSIAAKKDKILVRQNAPVPENKNMEFVKESFIPTRARSMYEIKEEVYEELNISDEQFADENSDN